MSKESEDIEARLTIIDSKLQSLHDQRVNLVQQRRDLLLRNVELAYGITIGSIVTSKGVDHRVSAIETRWGRNRPWLVGNPRLKNGSFGTANRNLFDYWQKGEEQP